MKNPFDNIFGKGKAEIDQLNADAMAVKLSVNEPVKPLQRQETAKQETGLVIRPEDLQETSRPGRPGRLKEYEIRNRIQERLSMRPMGLFELAASVGSNLKTTKKHAEYLFRLGIIQKVQINDLGKIRIVYSKK